MTSEAARLGLAAAGLALLLAGCSSKSTVGTGDYPPPEPRDISGITDAVPRAEPYSRYGNPESYVVFGKRYYTRPDSQDYKERGIASWYGSKFHGRRTSSGEIYDLYKMTAAHRSLPLPTYARVTNLRNGRSIIVKINDRGPFHNNRIIDLSYVAAAKLGILEHGTGLVEVEAIDTSTPQPAATRVADQTAPEPPPAGSDALMYLQVGAFSQRDNADRLRSRLQTANVGDIHVVEGNGSSGSFFRVRVGPLASVDEADRIANTLASEGISETRVIID
jgi:rare lipoprotein A